jgi:hypothetical protein
LLDDVFNYQKARMPVFAPETDSVNFSSNIPYFFEEYTSGRLAPDIDEQMPTTVQLSSRPHDFATETEYNLRRVSSGYTLNLVDALVVDGTEEETISHSIPDARNTNLGVSFESNADSSGSES